MAKLTVEYMEENLAFFNNQDAETLRKLRRISEDTNHVGGAACEMRVIYNDAHYLFCPALNARPNANGEMRCSKHYGIMLHSTCIIGGDDPELWKFIDSILAWKAEPEKQAEIATAQIKETKTMTDVPETVTIKIRKKGSGYHLIVHHYQFNREDSVSYVALFKTRELAELVYNLAMYRVSLLSEDDRKTVNLFKLAKRANEVFKSTIENSHIINLFGVLEKDK